MKKPTKIMLSAVCASTLVTASTATHAFDLEDYATTFRATRDAYFKATEELRLANGKYRLFTGIVGLYGYANHYANGGNPDAIRRYGWPDLPEARKCRNQPDSFGGRNPVFPEAGGGESSFAAGFRGYRTRGASQHQAAGDDAYLHFRTSGFAKAEQAVAAYIAAFPFTNESDRALATSILTSDLNLAGQGIPPSEPHPSRDPEGQLREQLSWHYAIEVGPPNGSQYYNGDMYNSINALAAPLRYGEYCHSDPNICPTGVECVDSSLQAAPGVPYWQMDWNTGAARADSPYRFRCAYVDQPMVFPPKRVDPLAPGNWFALLGVSDQGDGAGLHARNGVSENGTVEDILTTYRATRDAYLKAANEKLLATGPYKAARAASIVAETVYLESILSEFE